MQIGEADGEGIEGGILFLQLNADFFGVIPGNFARHGALLNVVAVAGLFVLSEREGLAFGNIIAVPFRNLNYVCSRTSNHSLTAQTRVKLEIGSHVEAVELIVV